MNEKQDIISPAIRLRIKGKARKVKPEEIVLINAESNYSTLHLSDCTTVFTSRTLKYWSSQLPDNHFTRVHASFLINRLEIRSITKRNRTINMANGMMVSVSRKFKFNTLQIQS
ncbi:MAG: LytTR family transcriptional regulator [Saprospiraceae bacterium]|jgi:two-component system LytT family response regulator|nr:LytTR family transcriptional regulator [Saprospiraceae bacterium]